MTFPAGKLRVAGFPISPPLRVAGRTFMIMAVLAVWYSPDRRYRVELVDQRGRQRIRVIDRTMPVAELSSVAQLAEWLSQHTEFEFADLVED